ncbi:MAG: hypothetical protein ABSG21_15845, partial [Spirochaetia bacterium]
MKPWILRSLTAVLVALAALVAAPASVVADGPPQTPILRLELGMHSAGGWQVGTDAQGRFVITSSYDKTARLWDASSGQLLRIYRVPSEAGSHNGELYACALSPDGSIAAMGGFDWGNTVYLFDRQSGQMIKRLSGLRDNIYRLQFTPDGEYMAAVLYRGYAVWRCSDWSLVGLDKDVGDYSLGVDFVRRDGAWTMAASCYDGKIRCYRLGNRLEKLYEYDTGTGRQPRGLSFNPDGSLLAVGYADSALVQVLAVTSNQMSLAYTPDLSNCEAYDLETVTFSQDGETLYAGGRFRGSLAVLRIWSEAGTGPYRDVNTGGTSTTIDIKALPGGELLIGGYDPFWAILDASGTPKTSVGAPIIDFRETGKTLKLGPGGRAISFNGKEGGSGPLSFDTAARSLLSSPPPSDWKLPDTTSLKVENWQYRDDPSLNGKPLAVESHELSYSFAIAPGAKQFVLGTIWNLYSFDSAGKQLWKKATPGVAWGVNISDNGRLAVAALADGTVRWYRLIDGRELLALFPHPDGKRWVFWTPSGYYDASPGGEDLIGWQVNNGLDAAADFYPAAR